MKIITHAWDDIDDRDNLLSIVSQVRADAEREWVTKECDSEGSCIICSAMLADKLREAGFTARDVHGAYMAPNRLWFNDNNVSRHNFHGAHHWFVIVDDFYIVDITADQFHRGEDGYEIVISDVNDFKHYDF